jgi:hypothetical protein
MVASDIQKVIDDFAPDFCLTSIPPVDALEDGRLGDYFKYHRVLNQGLAR